MRPTCPRRLGWNGRGLCRCQGCRSVPRPARGATHDVPHPRGVQRLVPLFANGRGVEDVPAHGNRRSFAVTDRADTGMGGQQVYGEHDGEGGSGCPRWPPSPAFSRVGIPRIATALFLPEHGRVELEAWNASGPHPGSGCGPVYAVQVCDMVRSPRDGGGDLPRQPARLAGHRPAGLGDRHQQAHHVVAHFLGASEPPPPSPPHGPSTPRCLARRPAHASPRISFNKSWTWTSASAD